MAMEALDTRSRTEEFGAKVFADFIGTIAIAMAALGDRLGLFRTLAAGGSMTSQELALAASVDERYTREWLSGMSCAGYIEHDSTTGRFTLPEAHVPVLADEGGLEFMGGPLQETPAILHTFDIVAEAFRTGGGVRQSEIHHHMWEGMQRETAGMFNHLLVQQWIPEMPDVEQKLRQGARVADVGCGSGLALIRLAQAYPASRFIGYDKFPAQLVRARANAEEAGVADRVSFSQRDVETGLSEQFDIIMSFDVVHDAVHPSELLSAIRQALKPDGAYVMVDPAAGETIDENHGPVGTFMYGASIFYCMTTSLAEGGEGLGAAGLPPSRVRLLGSQAGFLRVRKVPIEHPLYAMYELRV